MGSAFNIFYLDSLFHDAISQKVEKSLGIIVGCWFDIFISILFLWYHCLEYFKIVVRYAFNIFTLILFLWYDCPKDLEIAEYNCCVLSLTFFYLGSLFHDAISQKVEKSLSIIVGCSFNIFTLVLFLMMQMAKRFKNNWV